MIATGTAIPVQYKKAHKTGGGIEPLILNLGLSLHPGAKPGPHSRYGRSEKERSFAPAKIRIPHGPAHSLVTILSCGFQREKTLDVSSSLTDDTIPPYRHKLYFCGR